MKLGRVVVVVVAATSAYYAVFGGEYGMFTVWRLERERDAEAEALAAVEAENEALRRYVEQLESDPATIERIARERFGMIRPGERLYRFADAPTDRGDAGDD